MHAGDQFYSIEIIPLKRILKELIQPLARDLVQLPGFVGTFYSQKERVKFR
jgi:hypothetical protein